MIMGHPVSTDLKTFKFFLFILDTYICEVYVCMFIIFKTLRAFKTSRFNHKAQERGSKQQKVKKLWENIVWTSF